MKCENLEWYKNAVFYEIYLRSFMDSNNDGIGDLPGLLTKLDYLKRLGVDCLWLTPIYPSPRKDDGYDISDYYSIDPNYGTIDDFKKIVSEVHKKDMRIILDLVVNHTSDQHPWFQSAQADPASPFRNYYVWSDTNKLYEDARIIFLDTEESNWAWDAKARQFYWHRFYTSQPDLNYENPAVRSELLAIIKYWLEMGIDGFRVDAVPYLFEKDGTNCENLAATHEFLKEMRRFVDENFPGRVLICEANQPPEDVVKYLGNDDEFHVAFQFPIMPKIFMALKSGEKKLIEQSILETPDIPGKCQWGTFLRNHDELTLEMVTPDEREWMWREYARDPRAKLNLGIRRRLAPLLDNDEDKITLANSLLFSLPGSPFLYYGDEIGMGDDLALPDRDGVRTPMQWLDSLNAGFSSQEKIGIPVISDGVFGPSRVNAHKSMQRHNSLWRNIQKMIQIRKQESVFCSNEINLVQNDTRCVLTFTRTSGTEKMLFIHNLSTERADFQCFVPEMKTDTLVDLVSETKIELKDGFIKLSLNRYQSLFLKPVV